MKKRIAFFILAMLVTNVSVFSKTGVFFDDEDGSKAICSTSKLTEKDFLGSDFFIPNINTPYHKDLNVQIFNLLKSKELKDGIDGFGGYYIYTEMGKAKGGEEIIFYPQTGLIFYSIYDKKKKDYVGYEFYFIWNKEEYEALENSVSYYDKCVKGIEWCNWTLENCANPTIRKSRTVSVPYTYQERVLVEAGGIGSRTGSYGSRGMTQDRYEIVTRTGYRDEIQYYDAPNPNYNPENVAKAKKDLSTWRTGKTNTESKLKSLPLTIFVFTFEEEMEFEDKLDNEEYQFMDKVSERGEVFDPDDFDYINIRKKWKLPHE